MRKGLKGLTGASEIPRGGRTSSGRFHLRLYFPPAGRSVWVVRPTCFPVLILKITRRHFAHVSADGTTQIWYTERLWELARSLPARPVPLASIAAFDEVTWFGHLEPTCRRVAEHVKRIQAATFEHPVILSAEGWVMDGMHRICKAFLLDLETIQAWQFSPTPDPDEVVLGTPLRIPSAAPGAAPNKFGARSFGPCFELHPASSAGEFGSIGCRRS